MIPAEAFPTRYRSTCHGLSAASGKLGSILVEIFATHYKFGSGPGTETTRHHGVVLFVFSACMVIGAAVTHFWIPPVQQKGRAGGILAGMPHTLEMLALGRMGRRSRDVDPRKGGSRSRARGMSFGG